MDTERTLKEYEIKLGGKTINEDRERELHL